MKDESGSIRTSIQGQSGGAVAAAGERSSWRWWRAKLALEREPWSAGARMRSPGPPEGGPGLRRARLEAVITTAAMNEAGKSAWCREHGVYPAELDKWRASCTTALAEPEDARASPQATRADRKRIKELERELLRKDRALAETAALLVLSKKVAAIFNKGEDE